MFLVPVLSPSPAPIPAPILVAYSPAGALLCAIPDAHSRLQSWSE